MAVINEILAVAPDIQSIFDPSYVDVDYVAETCSKKQLIGGGEEGNDYIQCQGNKVLSTLRPLSIILAIIFFVVVAVKSSLAFGKMLLTAVAGLVFIALVYKLPALQGTFQQTIEGAPAVIEITEPNSDSHLT